MRRDAGTAGRPPPAPAPRPDAAAGDAPGGPALLEVRDLRKSFGAVQAVRGVSFDVRPREVVAVVGDNGAGKSTVIKMIAGAHRRDAGAILWEGREVDLHGPDDARRLGIETMYQELALVPDLDVAGNVFLGQEPMRRWLGVLPVLDRPRMRRRARELLERVRITMPSLDAPVRQLSGGQRQATAIARFMLSERAKLIIMDEPTAALGVQEQRKVLDLIEGLAHQEIAVLVISHNLDQVFRIARRVVVLRAGRVAGVVDTATAERQDVVGLIMGANEP